MTATERTELRRTLRDRLVRAYRRYADAIAETDPAEWDTPERVRQRLDPAIRTVLRAESDFERLSRREDADRRRPAAVQTALPLDRGAA